MFDYCVRFLYFYNDKIHWQGYLCLSRENTDEIQFFISLMGVSIWSHVSCGIAYVGCLMSQELLRFLDIL